MHVDVPVFEDLFRDIQQTSVCLQIFQSQHSRFFHDITQITGQCQSSAFTLAQAGFHEQDFTTYGCPCQTGYYTCILIALIFVTRIFRCSQILADICRLDIVQRCTTFAGKFQGNLTHYLVDFLLQLTNTTFTGVVFDDVFQCRFRNLHVFLLETIVFQFLWYQVTTGNFYLFFSNVTAHFNQFHTVEQGRRDCSQVVGCGNEHYFRQVVIHIQVIVVECIVLFRIQYFQHGRTWISTVVTTQLVDFIQDDDRIRCFCLD